MRDTIRAFISAKRFIIKTIQTKNINSDYIDHKIKMHFVRSIYERTEK